MERLKTSGPVTVFRSERGVTIIELLVAVLLLTLALIGLAAAIGPAVLAVTQGGLQTVAVHLAQDRIEVAKRTAFDSLDGLAAIRTPVSGFGNFEREVQVQPYTSPGGCAAATPCEGSCPTGDCKRVTVSVFFVAGQGEVQTTLSTVRVGP